MSDELRDVETMAERWRSVSSTVPGPGGLLLTTLADNVADVAETDEEIDVLVERLRFQFKLERGRCLTLGT